MENWGVLKHQKITELLKEIVVQWNRNKEQIGCCGLKWLLAKLNGRLRDSWVWDFFFKNNNKRQGMLKTWHMCLISHSACATPHLFEPRQPVFRSTWGSTINPGKKHKESESMTKKIEEKKEMSRLMPEKKHILQQQCPSEKSETIRRLFRIWLITTWWRFFFDPNWTITIHGSKSVKHHGFWHPVSTMGNFQNFSHQHFGGMTYQPGTLLSSIFSFDPSKTRSFPTKTRVTWAPGIYTNINIYCIYIYINIVCVYIHT